METMEKELIKQMVSPECSDEFKLFTHLFIYLFILFPWLALVHFI